MSNHKYRAYGCYRPSLVRHGAWSKRATHEPNFINENKVLALVRAEFGGMTAEGVDNYLSRAAYALGGLAPDDPARAARLEAEATGLRNKLADLAVGLDGVRNASPAATEALIAAMTAAGKQLDRVRAELAELDGRKVAAPDFGQARTSMLLFIEKPGTFDLPPAELQPLLRAALPALYVRGGRLVSCSAAAMTSLLTTTEAAAILGITPESVRRQINRGRLRGEKRGRDWFASRAEVARYQAVRKTGRPPKEK